MSESDVNNEVHRDTFISKYASAKETSFGDAITFAMRQLKMTQEQLAIKADVSQSLISRIVRNERPLTPVVADKLAVVLGTSAETLLRLADEFRDRSTHLLDLTVANKVGSLTPVVEQKKIIGTQVRRLWKQDILQLFGRDEEEVDTAPGDEYHCQISHFDAARVKEASYDTRVGGYATWLEAAERWNFDKAEPDGIVIIPPHETRFICSMEHIALPSWLEAEVSATFHIVRKGLLQLKGPVISPLWSGKIVVGMHNLGKEPVVISQEEPFLTLRFWLAKL